MDLVQLVQPLEAVLIDPFFLVDAERTIIHFNRPFFAMLPRSVARGLQGKKCYDVLQYDLAAEHQGCIVAHCWAAGRHIRLDEIQGRVVRSNKRLTLIVSALPFFAEDGTPQGAMVLQRNVTDEAQVQVKYQEMLENARREQEQLKNLIRMRTQSLLQTGKQLLSARRELMAYKRGRLG